MRHIISLTIILALFWLINSGHYDLLLLSLGLASVLFTLILSLRMRLVDDESHPLHLLLKAPKYYVWLFKEIVWSNFRVIKHIISGNESISPTVGTINSHPKSDLGKAIFANSITLTPGTVAIELEDDEITVHALLASDLASLQEGEMDRRVSQLERP